jgi:HEAT repeat protein
MFILASTQVGCFHLFYPRKTSVAKQIESLKDEDASIREKAIYTICLDRSPEEGVSKVILELITSDESPDVCIAGLRVLNLLNVKTEERLEVLVNAFPSENPGIRAAVMYAASRMPWEHVEIRGLIKAGFEDDDVQVRLDAAKSLRFRGPAGDLLPSFQSALGDQDFGVRFYAAKGLTQMGELSKDALGVLIEAIDNPAYRRKAIYAIGRFGPKAHKVVPVLVGIINDKPEPPLTEDLIDAMEPGTDLMEMLREKKPDSTLLARLELINPDYVKVNPGRKNGYGWLVPRWHNGWRDEYFLWTSDHAPRVTAIRALAAISKNVEHVDLFLELLEEEHYAVPYAAIEAIGEMGKVAKTAIPRLIELLETSEGNDIRREICEALSKFGPDAKDAVPVLINLLDKRTDELLRRDAVDALGKIGPDAAEAVPILLDILQNEDWFWKNTVIGALGGIGEASAVPVIRESLLSRGDLERRMAAWALGKMGVASKAAVPELISLLNDKVDDVRLYAAYALREIGPDAKDAVPKLMDMLTTETGDVKYYVIYAFAGIGPAAKPAIPELIKLLDDESPRIRLAAVEVLEHFGPAASDTLPKINELADNDPDEEVRIAAKNAIGAIEEEAEGNGD